MGYLLPIFLEAKFGASGHKFQRQIFGLSSLRPPNMEVPPGWNYSSTPFGPCITEAAVRNFSAWTRNRPISAYSLVGQSEIFVKNEKLRTNLISDNDLVRKLTDDRKFSYSKFLLAEILKIVKRRKLARLPHGRDGLVPKLAKMVHY